MLITRAPAWAEGDHRPGDATAGTWKPDPAAFEGFAQAVATRYSGTYVVGGAPIPAVDYFQVWAEPNLSENLTPQWEKKKGQYRPASPARYRKLLNSFYDGVQRSGASAPVMTGGTAPYGDYKGGRRMRPLKFWSSVFCLDPASHRPRKCDERPRFDILAHHPITFLGSLWEGARHADDLETADFGRLVKLLRRAESHGLVRGHHSVWATELWWVTKPPNDFFAVTFAKQARLLQDAFYILWREGAAGVIWFQLDDTAALSTGLFTANGEQKPSFQAFRFPFVIDPQSKRTARAWTIPPAGGELEIQRSNGSGWKTIKRVAVDADRPEATKVGLDRKAKYRGLLSGEATLVDKPAH